MSPHGADACVELGIFAPLCEFLCTSRRTKDEGYGLFEGAPRVLRPIALQKMEWALVDTAGTGQEGIFVMKSPMILSEVSVA